MRLASVPVLGVLGVVLAGIVAAELLTTEPSAMRNQPQRPFPAAPVREAAPAEPAQAQSVSALLARPPFAPDRRPDPGQGAAGDPTLPHLTGILISGDDRRAIFNAPETGRPEGRSTVVREGESVGTYRVQAISSASVMLTGPGGLHTVQPRFSNAAPPPGPIPGLPMPPMTVPQPQALQDGARFGQATGLPAMPPYRLPPAAPALAALPASGSTQ